MKNVLFIFLFLLSVVAPAQSDFKAASELWDFLSRQAGIKKSIVIRSNPKLNEGAYIIKADTVFHNSTLNNPAAIYAVARIAEELWDAVMIRPGINNIKLQKKSDWRDIFIEYTPVYTRLNFANNTPNAESRLWFHWHHIPTSPAQDGTFWHRSWFLGLAQKHPQLAPPSGLVTEKTKPDILHNDFPKIIYEYWVSIGRPVHVSLFEIDGTGFWWPQRYKPAPSNLNPGELDRYNVALSSNLKRVAAPGDQYRMVMPNGQVVRWPLTENFNLAQEGLDVNNRYERSTGSFRFNLTAYYLRMYKSVQAYFDTMGASHVRFNVLAYSAYRCLPKDANVDLSRFDVYYVSPTARYWNREEMLQDAKELLNWKRTGARLIWRPNSIYVFQNRLIYPLVCDYLKITCPDGLQVPPYSLPTWPKGNGLDYYALFRTLQGKGFADYFKYVPDGYMEWHDGVLLREQQVGKDEDDL